jgi:hypothetical protein
MRQSLAGFPLKFIHLSSSGVNPRCIRDLFIYREITGVSRVNPRQQRDSGYRRCEKKSAGRRGQW